MRPRLCSKATLYCMVVYAHPWPRHGRSVRLPERPRSCGAWPRSSPPRSAASCRYPSSVGT